MEKESYKSPLAKNKYAEYIRDFTSIGNPFLLLLVSFLVLGVLEKEQFQQYFIVLIVGFLLNEFICSSVKYLWHKPRPNGQKYKNALEKIDAGSFPSIHASRMAFVYSSLSYIQYQQGHYIYLPVFFLIILTVGYSRVFLKKHFWFDVLFGYLFWAVAFFLAKSFLL